MAKVAVKKYEGYRGWGPLMDDPDSLRERVCTEQMNNALVAALFLTMTIPWFCEPPDSVHGNELVPDWIFGIMVLLSLTFQFISLSMSITIIGVVNKLTGVDVVHAVQQLWSDNGFRAGPIAFLFSNLSWISTAITALYAGSFAYSSWAVAITAAVLGLGVLVLWVVNTAVLIPQYLNHNSKGNDVVATNVA